MIEFVSVTKSYNDLVALEDVTFEIEEGEFAFFIGPSGSGKTTIIKLLIRDEEPSKGKIFFYDSDISKLKGSKIIKLRREMGVVFQDFKLLPYKNIYENIAFTLEVSGRKEVDIKETVQYVLELVGLTDRQKAFPHEISGGEQQKIAIARAVANNPKLLVADEPTGNLDPQSSWEIIKLLSKINEWGTTIIMATHGSDIVNTLGKRVIELDKGIIISDNKKGSYPSKTISIPQEKKKTKQRTPKAKKTIVPTSKRKEKDTKPVPGVKEKEFEISFTTKPTTSKRKRVKKNKKVRSSYLSKRKKRRQGRDVVDLYKLKLPESIEEILIREGITKISKLKKMSKEEICNISGIGRKSLVKIIRALAKRS